MNAEWLRYFVVIAETRNLQVAAERLHVTPQAVSKALQALEHEYKVVLVARDRRIRGLTPAGEAFLAESRKLLAGFEDTERAMASWRTGGPKGPVTIAGDSLWHHYLLPPLLRDLVATYPDVRPRIHEMLPDDIERWVAEGEVDVGLLLRPPERTDLDWTEGLTTPYAIAGPPGPKQAWQDFSYIVPRFFRRELTESLDGWPEARYPRRIVAEVELLETAIHLVEAGVGAAFLPLLALEERIARGTLALVADPPVDFTDRLFVVWRKGVRPTPAAGAVLAALREAHAGEQRQGPPET